jgi:polygalacturonase
MVSWSYAYERILSRRPSMRIRAVAAWLTVPLCLLSASACSDDSDTGANPGGTGGTAGSGGSGADAGTGGTGAEGGGTPGSVFAERTADWSHAGVVQPDGTRGIPARTTTCATVDAATYGNGTTDATQAIQSAIDGCPDVQVVLLPAGRIDGAKGGRGRRR